MILTSQHAQAARYELARRTTADFAATVDIPTVPVEDEETTPTMRLQRMAGHHKLLCDRLDDVEAGRIPNLMVFMPPGSAKALALDTPVPTPTGWTSMGELRVGDAVFDETGKPCNVTWVSPVHRQRPVYAVTTDCGDAIIADRDHEWLVRLCGKRPVFKIKETHELHKKRSKRPMITRAAPLQTGSADLPIDPYLLGVWLGDGHSGSMRITSSVEDQPWLRAEIERLGYETRDSSEPTLFGVPGVRKHFAGMGLLHDPHHNTYGKKYIPAVYMRASESQRLSLLQGLIDTDGTICKRSGAATFCNTSRALSEQVRELVRSLGVKAGWVEGRAMLNGKDCGPMFRVSFYHSRAARMPRKAILCRDQWRTPDTYIDVEPAGVADTVCIEVDSPSHLFLCGRSMTPTHNSTYVDVVFVPRFMALKPRRHVILASYASNIAAKQGRRARQLIKQPAFQAITGHTLDADKTAADEWMLTNGSEYMAGGILSGLTGNRAALGILDDPMRGREAAESETIREKTWEAYQDDFCSRLIPGAPQIMILTRWHQADPAGRILPDDWDGESGWFNGRDGRKWYVLCLPAIADRKDDPLGREIGETLWPEWFNEAHWAPFKTNPRTWSSLYQQKPSPDTGTYFQRDWVQHWDVRPQYLNIYATSDYAVTEDGGDYTVLTIWGVDAEDNIYRLDQWTGQTTPDVWMDEQVKLIRKWKPLTWFGEAGVIQKAIEPMLMRRMREAKAYCRTEWIASISDKPTRARAFQSRMSMGKVFFEPGADVSEFLRFPAGKHDDQVDTASLMGMVLDIAHPAVVPKVKVAVNPRDAYTTRPSHEGSSAWG